MITKIMDLCPKRLTIKQQCDGILKLAYSLRFFQNPFNVRTVDVFNYFWGIYDDNV